MKIFIKIVSSLCILFFSVIAVYADKNIENVFTINSYAFNQTTQSYENKGYGSAVYIGGGKIITNAHVVLDDQGDPYKYYEICKTFSFKQRPSCLSIADLKAYSIEDDIAYLSINSLDIGSSFGVTYSLTDPNIGDDISILGYPSTGGSTITLTEGKISGYSNGYYKTDTDIDAGNSGGAAFNSNGFFIGMPTQIQSQYGNIGYIIPAKDIREYINGLQTSEMKNYDINHYSEFWSDHKDNFYVNSLDLGSIQVKNIDRHNFEVAYYKKSGKGHKEYILNSTVDDTTIQIINIDTLAGLRTYTDTWEDFKDNKEEKYITKQVTLAGKQVNILVILTLKTQDISIYLYTQSSGFNIYSNMKDVDGIRDALTLYVSSTQTQDKPTLQSLSYKGVSINQQKGLVSLNYLFNGVAKNSTILDSSQISVEFTELESYYKDYIDELFYEGLLEEYIDYSGYITRDNFIASNKDGDLFTFTKLESTKDGSITYAVNKYTILNDIFGYHVITAVLIEDDSRFEKKLFEFLDNLQFEGDSPITAKDLRSAQKLSRKY